VSAPTARFNSCHLLRQKQLFLRRCTIDLRGQRRSIEDLAAREQRLARAAKLDAVMRRLGAAGLVRDERGLAAVA